MDSNRRLRAMATRLVFVLLLASAFLSAFLMVQAPLVAAEPGDPVISGQVTDNSTTLPISGALVRVEGQTVPYLNQTLTDAMGNYSINVPAGIHLLAVGHGAYYLYLDQSLSVSTDLTQDIALDPAPTLDATIKGYVNDSMTSLPITTGWMIALSPPFDVPNYVNWSYFNATGYYEIQVFAGSFDVQSEVDGYLMSSTVVSISSGETLWVNMSLDPLPPETAVVQGFVSAEGTGAPIDNALVFLQFDAYSNSTATNATGYYSINASAGDVTIRVSALGFATEERSRTLSDFETLWENFTLKATNSTVKGNILDSGTGLGIDGAVVFVGDMVGYMNFTLSNASGYYEMRTIAGSLILASFASGYVSNATFFAIADGQTLWINISLRPEDAVLKGYIDEFNTGNPLAGVLVSVNAPPFSFNETFSNATGYYELNFGSGSIGLEASLSGYQLIEDQLTLAPGVNWYNFTMYPDLPENAVVQGYVNGSVLPGARVRAEGYGTWFNETVTDGTGFYSMNVVPATLTLFTRASQHAPNWTVFTVAGGETLWLNITLASDTTPPLVTSLSGTPSTNISANRETRIRATIVETWLDRTALTVFAFRNATTGIRNYTLLSTFPETSYSLNETTPGNWDLDFYWDAKIPGGNMGNASGREWVPLWTFFVGPWDLVLGQYQNASTPSPIDALAFFSSADGSLELFSFFGPPEPAPTDPTGEFRTVYRIYQLDDFNNVVGPELRVNGTWFSILDVNLVRDDKVASGNYGFWLQAWDYGDSYGQRWTFVDVDNTPPVANAGPDQAAVRTSSITFNGTASTDNVGIISYAWTFWDGGNVTLFGPSPSRVFNNAGNFEVTLTVVDGALNEAVDTMWVNITLDTVPPVANAGPDQTVDEDTIVTFDGSGSSDDVGVVNYTWTFTDGTAKTLYGVAPTYTFASPGVFVVTLTVRDLDGNSDTDTVTITVRDVTAPVANAGPNQTVDEDTIVTFNGTGSSDNVGVVNYTWTFTDGTARTLYGVSPNYTFATPGVYDVTLRVTDAAGNNNTDTVRITVRDVTAPVARAGADQTVERDTPVNFDGSASTDNVGVVNYTWDFGDGTLGYGATPTRTYTQAGEYTVTLTVRDAAGNEGSDTLAVTVQAPPGFQISDVVLYAIIGVVVGAVVIVIVVVLWRRGK